MKARHFLPAAAMLIIGAACTGQKDTLSSGIRLENMDDSYAPGTTFFDYATKGWQKLNPMPEIYSRYGAFDQLAELNQNRINEMVSGLSAQQNAVGSNAQKIGDLYSIAMDSVKLNQDSWKPLEEDFAMVDAASTLKDIPALLAGLHRISVGGYMSVGVGADEKDSRVNAISISQSGLSMSSRDYYLDSDASSTAIREAFKKHVERMYLMTGFDEAAARKGVQVVMDVETALAKAFRSPSELRDPIANYNKMTLDELKKAYPTFGWDSYFKALGLKDVKEVVVGQPQSLAKSVELLSSMDMNSQKLYLKWKVMDAAAGYLSDDIVEANFDFYGRTVRGTQSNTPRWRRAVNVVSSALGEAVGQLYVEKYFPEAAKQRMLALVENLRTALGERISASEWMSDQTKAKALEKLAAFTVKIGYPDKWRDYSSLDIENDSYWANIKRYAQWETDDNVSRYGKPVDVTEWFMTPQTVNAYYNPTTNEICFPAGILQYPFFDMEADDAFNYGAIGVVIGHEMTHGFDDQGRLYDKDGNLSEWWTEEDSKRFSERAQVLVDYFSGIEVAPGVKANGEMTLGENIADHGGLKVSFQAFRNATKDNPLADKDGFTAEQRFFLAYAGVWACNIREQEILSRTKSDVHSLGRWRVDGSLPQIDEWYEAFGITEKDPMFIPKEKRANVW